MRKRSEDWRDLLATYTLAFDAKKLWVGFVAIVCTVFVVWAMSMVYARLAWTMDNPAKSVSALCDFSGRAPAGEGVRHYLGGPIRRHLGLYKPNAGIWYLVRTGAWPRVVKQFLPLLNPLHNGNVFHCLLSLLTWVLLFVPWTRYGGIISRLTVLEYAKDDLPTLREARESVGARWKDYWLAPVMPLLFIVVLIGMCALGGLVASIPILGRVLLIIPGFPMLLITSLLITLLAVLGVLSFGMMMPGISAGGKDGFDAFATAYSYVIWGLRKFILFSVILGIVGWIACLVVTALISAVLSVLSEGVDLGFLGSWLLKGGGTMPGDSYFRAILLGLFVPVYAVAAAYAFSYYFTGNTIMFFLLRKDQDNIDIDEIYEELEEEDFGELEAAEEGAAEAEGEEAGSDEAAAEEETAADEDLPSEEDEED
jgi:hypothetical protein